VVNIFEQEGEIVSNPKMVNRGIVKAVEKLHQAPHENTVQQEERWRGLPDLTVQETIALMEKMP